MDKENVRSWRSEQFQKTIVYNRGHLVLTKEINGFALWRLIKGDEPAFHMCEGIGFRAYFTQTQAIDWLLGELDKGVI